MVANLHKRSRAIGPIERREQGDFQMNELHKAYTVLGLEPGAPFETVKRRYRRLALVWHPDRMTNADAKREAEEELKKINNNYEKLRKHFEADHRSGPSCRCQPAAAGPPPNNTHQSAGNQKTNSQSGSSHTDKKWQEEQAARKRAEEQQRQAAEAEAARKAAEEARKRDEERIKKAAAEEAARRAAEAAQQAQEKQRATEDALKGESVRKEEALRWKCARLIGIAFIGLVAYCWLGCTARDITHEIGKQWENFQEWLSPKQQSPPVDPPSQPQVQPVQPYLPPPYVPPYERPPVSNPTSFRQLVEEVAQQREAEERQQRRQAIYAAKLEIDRAQREVDQDKRSIAQMDSQLADPFVSDFQKIQIRQSRDFRQHCLETAQAELRSAQDKLEQLEPTWPFGPPQEPPSNS